jgi:hypothetical protein
VERRGERETGVLKYRKSMRASFGRNICTSDVFDAASNRRTLSLTHSHPCRDCVART